MSNRPLTTRLPEQMLRDTDAPAGAIQTAVDEYKLLREIADGLSPIAAAYSAGDASIGLALEWMEGRDWERVVTALLRVQAFEPGADSE